MHACVRAHRSLLRGLRDVLEFDGVIAPGEPMPFAVVEVSASLPVFSVLLP